CMGQDQDARSDIYAFGCLMYELLTGKQPLRGTNVLATFHAHITQEPLPLSIANPDVAIPPELERIVLKALEKDPGKRHQSSDELRSELESVLERTFMRNSYSVSADADLNETIVSSHQQQIQRMLSFSSGNCDPLHESEHGL